MNEPKQNYTIDIERLRREQGDDVANAFVKRLFARAADPASGITMTGYDTDIEHQRRERKAN